jgi:dihydrofolate reductase
MWGLNAECDTMLLGRVTYLSFAGAFANAPEDDPVAGHMNRPAKLVVSSTLKTLEWKNSSRLDGDVVERVRALKEEPGKAILVVGSIQLSRTLLRAGLVDELNLLIHPIVVGRGQRLFEQDGPQVPLALASSTPISAGVVHGVYRRA